MRWYNLMRSWRFLRHVSEPSVNTKTKMNADYYRENYYSPENFKRAEDLLEERERRVVAELKKQQKYEQTSYFAHGFLGIVAGVAVVELIRYVGHAW